MLLTGLNETEYRVKGRYTFAVDYDLLEDPEKFRWSEWSNQIAFGSLFDLPPVQGLYGTRTIQDLTLLLKTFV